MPFGKLFSVQYEIETISIKESDEQYKTCHRIMNMHQGSFDLKLFKDGSLASITLGLL